MELFKFYRIIIYLKQRHYFVHNYVLNCTQAMYNIVRRPMHKVVRSYAGAKTYISYRENCT
jgi:hypothetical protein